MDKINPDDVEQVILQALGHTERRNILKIIGASDTGVTYSNILGETGLDTGHLNYHLRGLEGLIERSDDRIYTLSPLGVKALRLLKGINDEVNGDVSEYIKSAKGSQESLLHPLVKALLLLMTVACGVTFMASLTMIVLAGPYAFHTLLLGGFFMIISGVTLYYLVKSMRTVPLFIRKLERKLLSN